MSNDIEAFLTDQNFQGKASTRSQLTPYTDEILELKKRGCTEKMILQFLQEKKGVVVTQSTLNWFINSRRKKLVQVSISDSSGTLNSFILSRSNHQSSHGFGADTKKETSSATASNRHDTMKHKIEPKAIKPPQQQHVANLDVDRDSLEQDPWLAK